MAQMVPALPRDDASRASRRIYERLRTGLDDQWTVVQSAAWVGRSERGGPMHDGQADFVVAHAEHGIVALTLVEGGLQHDPSANRWFSIDLDGRLVSRADPFEQAHRACGALLQQLADHPAATPSRPAHGHGVLLPDIVRPKRGFAAHAPAEIALDRNDFVDLPRAIIGLCELWSKRQPATGNAPSRWWWQAFEDLFLAPRQARVLLAQRIADDQADMVALSPQQLAVLDMLARVRRQAIFGPAGTGKTLLAMHKARALARQGQRVLLTCYNKALGSHMRQAMADTPGVVAGHFHELCYDLAGLDRERVKAPEEGAASQQFFDVDLARALHDAAAHKGGGFDALVVDEAQDFLSNWWQALDAWLIDPEHAIKYTFFDDAQRLRPDAAPVEGGDQALSLTVNWRNTQAIHSHLSAVEPVMALARCVASQGLAVQHENLRPNAGRALRRVLQRLCGEGGVKPEDIVVLTGRSPYKSIFRDFADVLKPWRLTAGDEPAQIRLRGVKSFKGMEAPVVVLCELDHYPAEQARRLHYVGASRATALLVVMQDAEATG